MAEYLYQELSNKIIKCFYEVYNTLGYGFLEKVYERSLLIELQEAGLTTESQKQIKVCYKDLPVGDYIADIIVDDKIIVEIKTAESLSIEHEFQLINYLKSTEYEIGLLLNFGKRPELKRKVFTKQKKLIRTL